jgi:hypothetical protein
MSEDIDGQSRQNGQQETPIEEGIQSHPNCPKCPFSDKSITSTELYELYSKKYSPSIAVMIIAKTCAVASLKVKNKDVLPLCVLDIGPSGHFKSRSSLALEDIFSKKNVLYLGSDFTIHSLMTEYGKEELENRCILVNDFTLLLRAKTKKSAKDRLLMGLAELMSEGRYIYSERGQKMELNARISLVGNMTLEDYEDNEALLQGSTLSERLLVVYCHVSEKEQEAFVKEEKERFGLKPTSKIKIKPIEIKLSQEDIQRITTIAKEWKAFIMSPSLPRVFDKIKALVCSHALLNGRDYLCDDEWKFLDLLRPHIMNPVKKGKDFEIVRLYMQSMKVKDIAKELGYSPNSLKVVYNVIERYKKRGVIPMN